jgi:hypothetical protein
MGTREQEQGNTGGRGTGEQGTRDISENNISNWKNVVIGRMSKSSYSNNAMLALVLGKPVQRQKNIKKK